MGSTKQSISIYSENYIAMFNAPMSEDRAQYLIKKLELSPQQTVVDFGCGTGTFLQLLATQVQITGVGIDKNDDLIQTAQSNWNESNHDSVLKFISADANAYVKDMSPVDAIICIGAEYIFGDYENLLEVAKPLLKPNGKLLVGTIYWKQPPSAEYLSLLNDENPHHDLHTTVEMAYQRGYLPIDVGRSNNDEWDQFESRSKRIRYQDQAARDATWQWQSGYLKWGIDTMGFCFLLFEKP